MVETRRITLRRSDVEATAGEPLLDLARRKARTEGIGLRAALNALRSERRERATALALADAPAAVKLENGTYQRVSSDPRWPFGVEGERVVAPFGLGRALLPRTVDPTENKNGPRVGARQAKTEARDIIAAKLERMGCDPIVIMAELAMDKLMKPEVRLRAAAELSTMVYPRLRGVESINREEKTVFVIAVPAEQPATATEWLSGVAARNVTPLIEQVAEDAPSA